MVSTDDSAHFPTHVRNSVRSARSRREGGTGVTAINSSLIGAPAPLRALSRALLFSRLGSHLPPSLRDDARVRSRAISVSQIRRSVKDEEQRAPTIT